MGCTACTEPQCLYKGELYLYFTYKPCRLISFDGVSLKNSVLPSLLGCLSEMFVTLHTYPKNSGV